MNDKPKINVTERGAQKVSADEVLHSDAGREIIGKPKPMTLRERRNEWKRIATTGIPRWDLGEAIIDDALDQLDEMAAAGNALLKRYDQDFCKAQDGFWGNMSDAYYILAKNAQHDWKRLGAALARYKGRDG